MLDLLLTAAWAAKRDATDLRAYAVGAVAVRGDGVIVHARNGSANHHLADLHAEARVLRKAGLGATVYVARVRRDGLLAMARPCHKCLTRLVNHRVRRVYYTIAENEFGCIVLRKS